MPVDLESPVQTDQMPCNRLGLDDSFSFRCGPELDCFTKCCHDVTIVLTPYDVLRLKRALRMNSSDFLERYTLAANFPTQKFPLVILRMDDETRKCQFVSGKGCAVYADRPWSCRMYPLGAAEPKVATAEDQPFHFIVLEDLCHGHTDATPRTVREWLDNQGVEEFEMMSTSFKALTLHDFWDGSKELTPEESDMFYMACYDVDRFRRFVFETRLLQFVDVDETRLEAMRTDDEEMLEFAIQWLRFCLFHERTMRLRTPPGGNA